MAAEVCDATLFVDPQAVFAVSQTETGYTLQRFSCGILLCFLVCETLFACSIRRKVSYCHLLVVCFGGRAEPLAVLEALIEFGFVEEEVQVFAFLGLWTW